MREKLLKQALESGKTKSKKLKSRNLLEPSSGAVSRNGSPGSSPNGSAVGSRSGSRAPSRQPSDEEEDSEGSEETGISTNSTDALAEDNFDASTTWEQTLERTINSLLSRTHSRRTTNDQHTTDLRWYIGILRAHYAADTLSLYVAQLNKSLLRTATSDSVPDAEALLALKAFALTAITTSESEDFFELSAETLKTRVLTAENELVKAECVHTLGLVTLLCGTEADTADLMTYLLDAISSDGTTLEAADSAPVVTAAIESYALLATTLSPASSTLSPNDSATNPDAQLTPETSHETITTLSEQLPSPCPPILLATAETLALLYSLSYRPFDPRLDPDSAIPIDPTTSLPVTHGLIQAYQPYRRTDLLLKDIKNIARGAGGAGGGSSSSSKGGVSKADKRALKTTFEDVLHSINNPGAGPRYNDSLGWKPAGRDEGNGKSGVAAGSRVKIKVVGVDGGRVDGGSSAGQVMVVVDTWVKWWRVKALRRWVSAVGLGVHYGENEGVRGLLDDDDDNDGGGVEDE